VNRIHRLKIDPRPLADLISRKKTAEVRKFDRAFNVGDDVYVYEYLRSAGTPGFTGSWAQLKISHITRPGEYGLPSGEGLGGAPLGVLSVILVGYGRLPSQTVAQIYEAGQPIAP
jgi:hypothetical protein